MNYAAPIDSYEATRNAAIAKIKGAAESTQNPILKEISKEEDPKAKAAKQKNVRTIQMVMDKGIEMYREGHCDFATCVKNITSALSALK